MDTVTVIYLLFLGLYIGLYTWFLVYLFKLSDKKCTCALTWHRKALIALIIIMIVCNIFMKFSSSGGGLVQLMAGIAFLLYLIISLVYIFNLKKIKCDCSKDSARTTMEVLNWLAISFTVLGLLVSVPFLLFVRKIS